MPIEYPSGATSRKVRAAATAAASREGFTSVAVIEREVSSARTTVASRPATESVARGRATPTINAASATSARANGSSLRMRRGAGADAATSAGVPNAAPWALRRRSPTIRSTTIAGITSRPSSAMGVPKRHRRFPRCAARTRSQSPLVESTTCEAPRGGEVGRDLAPLLPRPPPRTASAGVASLVSTRRRAAGLRIREPHLAHVDELVLARVADLDGEHVVPGGEVEERRAPVARAAEVGDDGDERPLARDGAEQRRAPAPARARRRARPRRRARAASRRGRLDPAGAATASARRAPNDVSPTRFPRALAAWPSASATPVGDVRLAAVGRPESHRRRLVEHDPGDEHALGELHPDVRLAACARSRSSRSGGRRRPARTAGPARARCRARARASDDRPRAGRRRAARSRARARGATAPASARGRGAPASRRRRMPAVRRHAATGRPSSSGGIATACSTSVEHVVRRPLLRERAVGEHEPVPQRVLGERADVRAEHVVAAVDQRERAGALDERDRPARAGAVLDVGARARRARPRRVARRLGERDGVRDERRVDVDASARPAAGPEGRRARAPAARSRPATSERCTTVSSSSRVG